MKVLLGTKLGMTRIFDQHGRALGVTAVQVWPATVLRLRTTEKDGYEAVQVGAGEAKAKRAGKAVLGQSKGTPYQVITEFPKPSAEVAVGGTFGIEQVVEGDVFDITSTSKGKGFQGTVKRHNFSRGPKSHGSRNYRQPGSVGGTDAARVFPGQKMPGRMGAETVTVKHLKVVGIHADEQVVLLEGSVPGPTGAVVRLVSLAEAQAPAEQPEQPPEAPKAEKAEKPEAGQPAKEAQAEKSAA